MLVLHVVCKHFGNTRANDALDRCFEVDDDAIAQVSPVLGASDDAPAGGDHDAAIGGNLVENGSLDAAEALLSVLLEDLSHGHARGALDQRVSASQGTRRGVRSHSELGL
jgi:hypothetical protein